MGKTPIDLEKILFAAEPLVKIKEEMIPLLKAHCDEVEWDKRFEIDPNWERYELIESKGGLIIFTAREVDKLIGYNVFFLTEGLHYKSLRHATQDLIYIQPDKRGFGSCFIYWCDEQLKLLEVDRVFYHTKANKDFGEKILLPLGYDLVDYVYGRNL